MFSLPRKSALRLISWNVNGLRAIMKRENDPLRSLVNKHQPDILCLSETKCQADTLRSKVGKSLGLDVLLEAEGYESYWAFSRDRKGYSGVAVFVRPSSERGTADVKLTYGLTGAAAKRLGLSEDREGRVLTLEFPDFYVVNTYVPNSGLKLDRLAWRTTKWDAALRGHLSTLEARGKPVIWTGDLNVAHADSDVMDPKKKRNKVPGFNDAERENFGSIVGGAGPIPEAALSKRTALAGRPGPSVTKPTKDCLGWKDAWWYLANGSSDAEKDAADETAACDDPREHDSGWTFWSYRFQAFAKGNGWRLDYFVLSTGIISRLKGFCRWKSLWGASDHIPIGIELAL
jgi:exodeoxyribonuclease-3